MKTRLRIWLSYALLFTSFLAMANTLFIFFRQTVSVNAVISIMVGVLSTILLVYLLQVPLMLGRMGPKRVLPPAGPVTATGRCGGDIGEVYSGPRVKVTVHSDRLTLQIPTMGEYTILGQDISSIADAGDRQRGLVIEHTAPGQASPAQLDSVSEELRSAISQIQRDPVTDLQVPDDPDVEAAQTALRNIVRLSKILGVGLAVLLVVLAVPFIADGNLVPEGMSLLNYVLIIGAVIVSDLIWALIKKRRAKTRETDSREQDSR